MLILVAVTVSVAMNGGIFNNAKEAQTGTQKAANKEELIVAMAGSYDSNGDFAKPTQLPEGAKWCKENETYENATNNPTECDWIITETGNKFYIDSSGSVLDKKTESVYSFKVVDLYAEDGGTPLYEVGGDGGVNLTYARFEELIGGKLSDLTSEYVIDNVIDFDTSNSSVIPSYYDLGLSMMNSEPLSTKYLVGIILHSEYVEVIIQDYVNKDEVTTSEQIEQFLEEAGGVTITLVKKDRCEALMEQMS